MDRREFLRKYKIDHLNPGKIGKDDNWYIAVTRRYGHYFSATIKRGSIYGCFALRSKESGSPEVIAEQFDVPPEVIGRIIIGTDECEDGAGYTPLESLINMVCNGVPLDVQAELSKLCSH